MLHLLRDTDATPYEIGRTSPMKSWLVRNGHSSLVKYAQLEASNFQSPLIFQVRLFSLMLFVIIVILFYSHIEKLIIV